MMPQILASVNNNLPQNNLGCKELGHYAPKCPERYNKGNTQGSMKRGTSTMLLVSNANRRDTIQIDVQRKMHPHYREQR
jgi:hypothetical protein